MGTLDRLKERLTGLDRNKDHQFNLDGREYVVNPEVFPCFHFPSTGVYTKAIPYPKNKSFWELGCGAGVTAITAAYHGCRPVVASDISSAAVENARLNIQNHGLESMVSARQGDLFDALLPGERFDLIFWNSNYIFVEDNHEIEDSFLTAFCDVGYETHRRFFTNARAFLEPGGSILLGFSALGDEEQLRAILEKENYNFRDMTEETGVIPASKSTNKQTHSYKLIRVSPK